jgi:hypothetical protein
MSVLIKKRPRRCANTPGPGPKGVDPMANTSVPKTRPAWRGRLLLALEEATQRYKHELLSEEERLVLHDRIILIKRRLARSA